MGMWAARLRDVLLCAGIALALWAPLGRRTLSWLGRGRLPRSPALAIPIGMGVWGFWLLLLGTAGLLYGSVLFLSAFLAFLALRLDRVILKGEPAAEGTRFRARDRIAIGLMCGVSIAYLALALGSSLAPETNFDALNVHLPYAREAAAAHRVGFDPNNWSSVMPALPLMAYITAFLLTGVTLAKLFNVLCYLLCGAVIYSFTRRWWSPMPALAAALLFWSCPVAVFESTTALIELPLVLFSSLATLSLLEWTSTHEDSLLRLSAVSLGFALGCKYHAAFWIAPFLLVLAFQAPRNDQQAGEGAVSALLRCFRYLCLAGILFLPWMIRAWHYTGNPVFPAANNFFRSPYFPPAMQQAALAAYANEGVGTGLKALLKLPWTATFHPGSFRGTLGFVFLLGTSVALLRCRTRRIRWGVGIAAAYFYTWAFTAQDIRYLLPLAPLLSVIAAAGLLGMECARVAEESPAPAPGGGSRRARVPGLAVVLMSSLISLPCIYPLLVKEWTYWHAYQSPLNYLLGRESAQDFARRDVPSIYVYDYINANLAVGDRILLLNDSAQFYSKVPTLYSFTVEAERLLFEESEQGLLSRLKESRITHVLLNYNGIKPLPGVAPRRGAYFFLDEGFQGRHLVPLFSKNKVVLYQVRG